MKLNSFAPFCLFSYPICNQQLLCLRRNTRFAKPRERGLLNRSRRFPHFDPSTSLRGTKLNDRRCAAKQKKKKIKKKKLFDVFLIKIKE